MVSYNYYSITLLDRLRTIDPYDLVTWEGFAGVSTLVDSEDYFFIPGTNIIGVEI